MKTGIIGLPQVGKTSLFKILTKAKLGERGHSNPREAHIGVARVSIPVASIMVAHRALKRFFDALHASPTGLLEGQGNWVSSFAEYTDFVGLKDYRHLEDEFLPGATLEVKYAVAP